MAIGTKVGLFPKMKKRKPDELKQVAFATKDESNAASQEVCQMAKTLTCPLYSNIVLRMKVESEMKSRLGLIHNPR